MKFQTQDIIDNHSLGFVNMPVRFFIWEELFDGDEDGYCECNESAFLEAEGVIEYERFTMHENGCKQICLTKNPFI